MSAGGSDVTVKLTFCIKTSLFFPIIFILIVFYLIFLSIFLKET